MSSIDACMDKLEREGDEMFRVFTENLEKARRRLSECKYIRLVTPQAWKAAILAGTPKDKTAAIQHVDRVYPSLNIDVGTKKVIYHDGVADAVCLAEYGAAIAR